MHTPLSLIALSTVLLACLPPVLRGQSTPCLATSQDTLSAPVSMMRDRFSRADSATAVNAGGLWSRRAEVYAVTDSATCAQAVAAYNSATRPGKISEAYVVRIGTAGFSVVEQDAAPSGTHAFWLFSPSWSSLGPPVQY